MDLFVDIGMYLKAGKYEYINTRLTTRQAGSAKERRIN
jgi:hypothetical protein